MNLLDGILVKIYLLFLSFLYFRFSITILWYTAILPISKQHSNWWRIKFGNAYSISNINLWYSIAFFTLRFDEGKSSVFGIYSGHFIFPRDHFLYSIGYNLVGSILWPITPRLQEWYSLKSCSRLTN